MLDPGTLYETPPARNSEKTERRTSNVERRILMTLRFIDFKTREPQNIEGLVHFAQSFFYKIDRIHYSMLDVQCSMFDVHFLVNPSYETIQGQSFF